jgi:hypothetical protein
MSRPGPHGSRLGRKHSSVRQHLIEDHPGIDPNWARDASDGAIHGKHDGLHNCTWACDYDLPHPGDSPFRQYADPALASRVGRGGRSGP